MIEKIRKRDGREVTFMFSKIANAINKAFKEVKGPEAGDRDETAKAVLYKLEYQYEDQIPTVEEVQDAIEKTLMEKGHHDVAKAYILYRQDRSRVRETKGDLMQIYEDLTFTDSKDSDLKRENGNISGDEPMAIMLRYGSEGAKRYNELKVLSPEQSRAHIEGDIHIHDLDFYTLTTTCCQIDLGKLFENGFNTGHGYIREPKSIRSAMSLAAVILQSNQNQQHGGQAVPNFDYYHAPYVAKSFKSLYVKNINKAMELLLGSNLYYDPKYAVDFRKDHDDLLTMENIDEYQRLEYEYLYSKYDHTESDSIKEIQAFARKKALKEVDEETYQAAEAFVHNMCSLHSRSGGQVVFSSINLGMDTSLEGRMVTKNLLLAVEAGLGKHETPIFPISIFKVKDGVNGEPGDPNYDLFELACRVSAKRMFPNFAFIDAPFNLSIYVPEDKDTHIAYMGCRTRVATNIYDKTRQIVTGRGNLSFTTINLPRIAIIADHDIDRFFSMLDEKIDLVIQQLLDRLKIQGKRHVYNYKFLMGQHIWIDSEKLGPNDEVAEVLKHGTLTCGFIGLAETLVALIGKHHGESDEAQELGLKIVKHMRERMDEAAKKYQLNFSLICTPAEGLSGRFTKIDKKKFGIIPGVTDREYYTNSCHIPVYYKISAYDKIMKEAPYHALTNGGHICYVEMDGDPAQNIQAFVKIVKAMKKAGIGYGAINHPIDRDPVCGFSGIIGDVCPGCGRREAPGEPPFERIRRITGYLVGNLTEFNNAKKAEEHDRVKHA